MQNAYPTTSAGVLGTHLGESRRDLLRLAGRRVDIQNRSLRLLGRNISAGHPSLPDSSGGEEHESTYDGHLVRRHIFSNDGTFTIDRSAPVDVFLVGGGGGGGVGNPDRGGGGAGGLVFVRDHQLSAGSYSVTVGEGGSTEENGGDSQFDGLTALGGGGVDGFNDGFDGGSGGGGGAGGAGGSATQPSSATGGYGHDGGSGGRYLYDNDENSGAGGGGAGAPGGDGGPSSEDEPAGDGGTGLSQVSVNSTTHRFVDLFGTSYGEVVDGEVFFAGGGAGGSTDGSDGEGGLGGGGDADEDGISNTGGGAGQRSVGGSGIVIIVVKSE